MNQSKAWLLAVILGSVGVLISGALFFAVLYFTGIIFGILTIGCGVISGFASAVGFKIGKGSFSTDKHVSAFLHLATAFGFLGVVAGYGALLGFDFLTGNPTPWVNLDLMDLLFVVLGAYGGRWAGEKYLMMQLNKVVEQDLSQEGAVAVIDSKFKS